MGNASASGTGEMSSMGHDHDKYHSSVVRLPDGSYTYTHGAFLGHVVPGSFFVAWGAWWVLSVFGAFLRSRAHRQPFRSRTWYALPLGPSWLRRFPLEPLLKVVLPLIGVLGELWLGHDSYRNLYAVDGKFYVDNINDWQHSLMYLCFIGSGIVDLVGQYLELPFGMEHSFLGLAFLGELLLLVFHLKGPRIEILLHLILALIVGATVLGVMAEALAPSSLVAACMRPYFTLVQGVWWIQTAYAMYTGNPAYDPADMGGAMMVPTVFVLELLLCALALLCALVALHAAAARLYGRPIPWDAAAAARLQVLGAEDSVEEGEGAGLSVELTGLMGGQKGLGDHGA
eukprot:scaffold6.g2855.t1